MMAQADQLNEGLPPYKHITSNDFSCRKHKKQKEEDVAICECQHDANDPDSACGERCLNVLTNTECTPGYCPCGNYCKNQKFQNCEYAMSKLFKTEGHGWGLLADENIMAGHFVIEYCGEVISWKEAKRRSQAYEAAGLKDAYIISLNAYESIDATKKGSLARFINHSCQPNCETRKWTVLGEIRVGIFAKQDIPTGTELAYDYNFEWYGGAKVRCLCGAACCSGFLGAKSRGFQEATYLWEDDDGRYSVENVPVYDSDDDQPTSKLIKATMVDQDFLAITDGVSESKPIAVVPLNSAPMEFGHKSSMVSRIRSSSGWRKYRVEPSPMPKSTPLYGKFKNHARKQVNVKLISERLASKEAREEIFAHEESKKMAASRLDSLYNEIRPAIEEHERDNQDSVATSVAEKWIGVCCDQLKAEFDLSFAIIKNVACTPTRARDENAPRGTEDGNHLENGR